MEFIQQFFTFPLAITAVPFCFLTLLMLISVFTGFLDDLSFFNFDADLDADIDADGDIATTGTWLPIGITRIPLTVSLTTITFVATVIIFYTDYYLLGMLTGALEIAASVIAIIVALFISLYIAAFLLKPLSPLFDQRKSFAVIDYVGMSAVVRSNKVSAAFGEAVVTQGSLENQLDIYSETSDTISYGDEVLIVSHNPELKRYLVIKK